MITEGCTMHYERIDGKWYVVWGGDFGVKEGKFEVSQKESMYLEMGYQIGKSEVSK
jgi:hypothetical protein